MTQLERMNKWIAVLSVLREKRSDYIDGELCEIIEFLEEVKTTKMSVTTQMPLADPDPVRRFDNRIEGLANEIRHQGKQINALERKMAFRREGS